MTPTIPRTRESVCQTCNDHGMIGGPSFYEPDEGGEPCPDCNAPNAHERAMAFDRLHFRVLADRDALCLPLMTDDQALATWERLKALRKAYVVAVLQKVRA